MNAKIENGKLIIELPVIDPPVPSKSGKTLIVATTHGNKRISVNGQGFITIGVNAYIKH